MDDLRELYQETILDHHKTPRNHRKIEGASRHAEGFNPLCGDRVTVYLIVEGDTIKDIAFEGAGCAICMASSSVMTEELKGKSLSDAEMLFGRFHDLVTSDPTVEPDMGSLGKLAIFAGVREYPIRIKCATLGWHTLRAALDQDDDMVSTE